MDSTIISGLISAGVTLAVCLITNSAQHKKTEALISYRLEQLEKKVDAHNNHTTRIYDLEKKAEVLTEKITVANKRIADLENDGK